MKPRNRFRLALAAIAALPLAAITLTAAPAHAGPPPPLTPDHIVSYTGQGDTLAQCATVGSLANFVPYNGFGGCDNTTSEFQVYDSAAQTYMIHPYGHASECLTASTTDYGIIKTEWCVSISNPPNQQLWIDYYCGFNFYQITSVYYGTQLWNKTKGLNAADLTSSGGFCNSVGPNGWTMSQS